jgi:hypothetical protein
MEMARRNVIVSGTQKLKYKVPENTCEVKTWSTRITEAKTIQTKANSKLGQS